VTYALNDCSAPPRCGQRPIWRTARTLTIILGVGYSNTSTINAVSHSIPDGSFWVGRQVRLEFEVLANASGNLGFGWMIDNVHVWTNPPPPAIASITPDHGPITGINAIYVHGSGFTGATQVLFGPNPAIFSVANDGEIVADLGPSAAIGWVDVSVTTPWGTGTLAAGFDYFVPPRSLGAPCSEPRLVWSGAPTLGESYTVTTTALAPDSQLLYVDWTTGSRFQLAWLDSACRIRMPFDTVLALGTSASHTFAIPSDTALLGMRLRTQAKVLRTPAVTTQILDAVIGE
jgi:hypothetical protein